MDGVMMAWKAVRGIRNRYRKRLDPVGGTERDDRHRKPVPHRRTARTITTGGKRNHLTPIVPDMHQQA